MKTHSFVLVAVTIFALVALLHLVRLVWRVPVHFGQFELPLWLSWVGLVAAAGMSIWGIRAARR